MPRCPMGKEECVPPAASALQKAMKSGDLKGMTENQLRSALGQAVNKLGSSQKLAKTMKENAGTAAGHLLHTAETQGTLFLASMAEGHQLARGKSLKLGPVDLRLLAGLPLMAWGMTECLRGKGGAHQLAIGNGFVGSAVASLGLQAGQALAEKRSQSTQQPQVTSGAGAPAAAAPPQLQQDGLTLQLTPESPIQGVREVLLHPATEGQAQRRIQ